MFQCYTHRHLGWKINVLDECDEVDGEESRVIEKIALPDDLQSEESIQVHTRVSPENVIDPRKKVGKIINTKTNYDNFSTISSLTGEVFSQDRNQLYAKEQEFELPLSNVQIKEVIQTVENIESKIKDDMQRDTSTIKPLGQYQVHEDVKESYTQEQPIREDDEYIIETGKVPETYFLPPNQKPLTLQSVLRPNGPKPSGNMRPPFRRPVPPEIKLRRPPPMYQKNNNGYPLPMPNHQNHHGPHTMQKKPQKYPNNRLPPNMRPPMNNIPPMKSMPPLHSKPQFNQGPQKHQGPKITSNVQSIILGKPNPGNIQMPLPTKSQTLSLGQTDIIANQVVKSHITLPGAIGTVGHQNFDIVPHHSFDTIVQHSLDSIAQHNTPQKYLKPGQVGQIILGKPMDNPIPLDQQMIQNNLQIIKAPPTAPPQYYPSTTLRIKLSNEHQKYNEIQSSDFIGESQESSTLHPAINTGFKPDSIVVESGFKPIIREPLMAAEDRIADGYETNSNRREDTDVEEDYEESPQIITNHAFPSDKITQSFEPMFIPSPEDHILPTIPTNDKTKEVFPKNHAKVDRPHPVYVKTESELNVLFSKKNMEKEVPDMLMESDKVSPHYLPPDPKLPKEHSQKLSNEQTFTTYDGKTVSADTLTSVPDVNKTMQKLFSSKLPANTALLLRTPQFGPFKGEIPPPVDDQIAKDSAELSNMRTTKLKLVNVNMPDKVVLDDLKADGSEIHEVTEKVETGEEEEEYDDEEDDTKKRRKRESKATQFERGEVEPVHTNGHSLVKNQINYDEVNSATAVRYQSLFWTTQIVLLTLLMKVF